MCSTRVWARLLGVAKTSVVRVEFDEDAQLLVAHVKPHESERRRCPTCRRRCPVYDRGEGRRRWRALDLGTMVAVLEADAPRVSCSEHGVLVAAVPWARHHAGHTRFFDDQVAWLAVQTSKTAVTKLMRIAWRTVGAIITRVVADINAGVDRLEGLRRIGIDEISYKKGHRYITVVVDHDTSRLVWAAEGRDKATVGAFFDALGPERTRLLTHVSADGRTGSAMSWRPVPRKRSAARTRSMSSRGRPRPWTLFAGRPGTTPGLWRGPSPRAGPVGPARTAPRPPARAQGSSGPGP